MRTRNSYCFQIFEHHHNLGEGLLNITPASVDAATKEETTKIQLPDEKREI